MCPCNGPLGWFTAPRPASHDARPSRRAPQMPEQARSCLYPCPCGYYGDLVKDGTCSQSMVSRYRIRIQGPLLSCPAPQHKLGAP
ncbi:ATP-binding protein [Chloroflexota bacterium]